MKTKGLIAIVIFGLMVFNSCKKEEVKPTNSSTELPGKINGTWVLEEYIYKSGSDNINRYTNDVNSDTNLTNNKNCSLYKTYSNGIYKEGEIDTNYIYKKYKYLQNGIFRDTVEERYSIEGKLYSYYYHYELTINDLKWEANFSQCQFAYADYYMGLNADLDTTYYYVDNYDSTVYSTDSTIITETIYKDEDGNIHAGLLLGKIVKLTTNEMIVEYNEPVERRIEQNSHQKDNLPTYNPDNPQETVEGMETFYWEHKKYYTVYSRWIRKQ